MNSFTTAEIHPHTLAALGLGNIAWLRCATTSALRAKGLVEKLPKSRRYRLCSQGYSICLCFALDLEEQKRSGFHYQYSNYQVEYSRSLIFEIGGHMDQGFSGVD